MMYPGTRRHGKSPRSEKATAGRRIQVGAGHFAHKQDDRHHHQPGRDDCRGTADGVGKRLPHHPAASGDQDEENVPSSSENSLRHSCFGSAKFANVSTSDCSYL